MELVVREKERDIYVRGEPNGGSGGHGRASRLTEHNFA